MSAQRAIRKTLKITLLSVGSLLFLLILAGSIVLHIVFHPQKITPIVNRLANKYLEADVEIGRIDVTLFSTFPHIGIEIENGTVVSHVLHDSACEASDSVLCFRRLVAALDVKTYWKEKRFFVRNVRLEEANCCLYTSSDTLRNFMIFKTSPKDESDTSGGTLPPIEVETLTLAHAFVRYIDIPAQINICASDLNLETDGEWASGCLKARPKIHISGAQVTMAALEAKVENLSLDADGVWDSSGIKTDLQLNIASVDALKDRDALVRNLPLNLSLKGGFNLQNKQGFVTESEITVKRLGVNLSGDFGIDSTNGDIRMNLEANLKSKSLQEVLDMVPPQYWQNKDIEADGGVNLQAHISGRYGKNILPQARLNLEIKDGHVQYAGMPYPIDTVNTRLYAYLDLNKDTPSYVDLKHLSLIAKDAEILAECKVNRLLTDPCLDFKFSTDVELGMVPKIYPLPAGLSMGGFIQADLIGKFRLKDLQNTNFSDVDTRGKFVLSKVFFDDRKSKTHFDADAQLIIKNDKYLLGKFVLNGLHANYPDLTAYVDSMEIAAAVSPQTASKTSKKSVSTIGGTVKCARLFVNWQDSLRILSKNTDIKGKLKPDAEYPERPAMDLTFKSDSILARRGDYRAKLTTLKIKANLSQNKKKEWWPEAQVDIRRITAAVPQLTEPVGLSRVNGMLNGYDFELENTRVRLGKSRLNLSGKIWNMLALSQNGGRIRADLELSAPLIDCNNLLNTLASPDTKEKTTEKDNEIADIKHIAESGENESASEYEVDTLHRVRLLSVPENFDLRVNLNADKIFYDRMAFENIKGKMRVRNGAVNLHEFKMSGWGADLFMNLVYASRSAYRADVGADIRFERIRIDSLIKTLPALDTALPMLRSFEGIVDLQTTASAQFDSNMSILPETLTAALKLRGDSLVVLDGETFAKIAKWLSFQNKKKNMIDSISAVITLQDKLITIYPFVVEMSQYRLAVGGWQNLDMSYQYHITLLKAPAIIKVIARGVTLSGNFSTGKLSFKLTKPLYKDAFTPAMVKQVDEARLDLGRRIMLQFEGWMNRERRPLSKVTFPHIDIPADGGEEVTEQEQDQEAEAGKTEE